MNTRDKIKSMCRQLEQLLLTKNEKYGDAALNPLNVFSKANASTGLKVRIDDKLKRIMNAGLVEDTEDTLMDLAGYMVLLMIANNDERNNIQRRLRQDESPSHTTTTSADSDSKWEVKYASI